MLTKTIADILRNIADVLDSPVLPTGYPVEQISWADLKTMLTSHGLICQIKDGFGDDYWVKYTNKESWAKIVPYLTYPASYYVDEVADCDDYAKWAVADSSKLFHLNGCLHCQGLVPGSHAFGLVIISPTEFRLFDPNAGFPWAGELFSPGTYGYTPKNWKT